MKKFAIVIGAAFLLSSCAARVSTPLTGFLYSDMKWPGTATGSATASKVGTAEASSILGWIATGDASIDAAAKSAGITKIHHVDNAGMSVLGIFAKYTVYVYGE